MSQSRVTVKDVRELFGTFANTAKGLGFDVEGWTLQTGSATNGIAWRMYTHKDHDGKIISGLRRTEFDDFLGMTARAAHETLCHKLDALWAVAMLRREQEERRSNG